MEGAAAAAAEGLDGPDTVMDLVGDDDMVVVEAAAEADRAYGVLVVLQGDDDGRVGVEPVVMVPIKTPGNLITSQYSGVTLSENMSCLYTNLKDKPCKGSVDPNKHAHQKTRGTDSQHVYI